MSAKSDYSKARSNGITLIATCAGISETQWNRYMKGTRKANGSLIRTLIKTHCPELYHSLALQYHNPYEYQSVRKDGLLVYVHSSVEYFFLINN